jgi:hypothetical protein
LKPYFIYKYIKFFFQLQVEFYFSTSGCIAGAMIGTQLLAIALMTPLTSQSLTQPAYQVTLNVATNLNFIFLFPGPLTVGVTVVTNWLMDLGTVPVDSAFI